jgi:transglutaminase-like putative cysteine protease
VSRRYTVTHSTTYFYDEEVTASYGRAHLVPRDCPGQVREDDRLDVRPQPDWVSESEDFYGNRSVYVEVHTAHTELVVTATSRVRVDRPPATLDTADAAVGWEQTVRAVDELLAAGPLDEEALRVNDFRLASNHVPLGGPVGEFAAEVFTPQRPVGIAVRELVTRIHAEFDYKAGVTSVKTTLAEVLARREGVCQDFAHLAVGALRSVGLPARYVSGYLETRPPDGTPKLVGADASHAWVSVLLPGLGWIDLDPTNDKVVDDSYVVTAWGRDYADVPPLKGVIYTESKKSRLSVAVDVVPVAEQA